MPGMMNMGGGGPMGGLTAARPEMAPPSQEAAPDLQAAAMVLQDAVEQYGPQIIDVLRQILSSTPGAGGEPPEGAGME